MKIIAILNADSRVVNRVLAEDSDDSFGTVRGETCAIGDIWTGREFIKPQPPVGEGAEDASE